MRERPLVVNWREGSIAPFESLWAIIHKVAILNHASARELRLVLGDDPPSKRGLHWNPDVASFRHLGYFDGRKLRQALRLSERQLANSTIAPYALPLRSEDLSLKSSCGTSSTLRFCEECLARGFHSPLYQCLWIARCPLHGSLLKDRCSVCNDTISYAFLPDDLENPFACGAGHVLWQHRHARRWESALTAFEVRTLGAFRHWYRRVRTDSRFAYRDAGFLTPWALDQDIDFYKDIAMVPGRWEHIAPLTSWPTGTVARRRAEHRQEISFGQSLSGICFVKDSFGTAAPAVPPPDRHREEYKHLVAALYPIYRSIKRHLLHRLLRGHRGCVADFRRIVPKLRKPTPRFCPWGYSFAVWEYRWETAIRTETTPYGRSRTVHCERSHAVMIEMKDFLDKAFDSVVLCNESHSAALKERRAAVGWLGAHALALGLLVSFDQIVCTARKDIDGGVNEGKEEGASNHERPYFLFEADAANTIRFHAWCVPILKRLSTSGRACRHSVGAQDDINAQLLGYWRLQHDVRSAITAEGAARRYGER